MKNRTEKISFLKGIIAGSRSILELYKKEEIFIVVDDDEPGVYQIVNGSGKYFSEVGRKDLTQSEYKTISTDPKLKVELIRIIRE